MFKLVEQECQVNSVTPFAEKHGDETKPGLALKMSVTMANTVLDHFNKEIRTTFFKQVDPAEADLADQGMDHDDYLPALRFPEFEKMALGWKGAGYRMVICRGVSGYEDIILIDTVLDKFKFECLQGGSVELEFRIKGHPNEKEMGQLCSLLGQEVELTLEPPSAEKLAQMELDAMKGAAAEDEDDYEDDHQDETLEDESQEEFTDGEDEAPKATAEEVDAALGEAFASIDGAPEGDPDPLYEDAVKIVVATKNTAISYLQRGLRIGYNRASKLLDRMEEESIISAPDEHGSREVLATAAA